MVPRFVNEGGRGSSQIFSLSSFNVKKEVDPRLPFLGCETLSSPPPKVDGRPGQASEGYYVWKGRSVLLGFPYFLHFPPSLYGLWGTCIG